MTYEDELIDAVKSGLFMHWTPELERLFRLVYRAGAKQEKIEQLERVNEDEELLRQAFDAIVNVLAGADYDDKYASLREAAKSLSDRLGGGLK